jgi:hypothetical protein
MPVNYTNAAKEERMKATRDHFAGGKLQIRNSSNTVLVEFTLTGGGGTVSNALWTLAFVNNTVAAAAPGTAHNAIIITSGTAADLTGLTVGTSSADVILDNTNITAGQNVTITSASITHAA